MSSHKPTYEDLEARLAQAEAILDSLRSGEVDAILGDRGLLVLRLRSVVEELRASEATLNETGSIARIGGWAHDLITGQATWTRALYEIIEIEPGRPVPGPNEHFGYYPPEDRAILMAAYQHAVETGEPFDLELRCHTATGRSFWARALGRPTMRDGTCIRMAGTFQDITERRQVADELRAAARFPAENKDPVLRIARDGTLLYANAAAVSQLADWQPQTDRPAPAVLRDIASRSLDQGSAQSVDLDCGDRLYSFSVAPIAEAGYTNLYGRDITQQKRAEEALQRFHRAVESSSDAVGMSTPQGEHSYQNRAFDEIFGEIGKDPRSTIYVDAAVGREVFETIMSGREWKGEVRMNGRHGNLLDILLRAYPMKDQQGAITGLVGVHTDVTEQRNMEVQLRQAQKMESVGRLAGGIAHDFNNLLMGTMNYVELCRDGLEPDHPIRKWLDEIMADSQRSANLTRQLLAFARKQTIIPKVLDINDAVSSMLKLLRRLIGEGINLAWLPGPGLGTVKMDPSQLDQILANLTVNARDAIGGVGKLTIETRNVTFDAPYCAGHMGFATGDYVLLAVSDDGCGMDAETREHIFEPFFTTKVVGEGTGLGLATVYGIVKQNNGFINVYSEPDEGTTFRIYLPRLVGESAGEADAAAPVARPGGNETILLVEDEKSIRVTAGIFLETFGYAVLTADCPAEALRLAAEHPGRIHLLITDVIMPGMSGRDLANRLLQSRPSLQCLFISGFTADVIAQRGILDDGVNFLSKPFGRDALACKVREVLGKEKE